MKLSLSKTAVAALFVCAAFSMVSCKGGAKAAPAEENLPSNVYKYESKGFQTYWINDNAEPRMNQASLFEGVTDEIIAELGIAEGIPSSMSTFLMKIDGKNVLFDTGMGGLLLPSLEAIGVAPENVDAIMITHLHGDHTGGLAKDGAAVFPNAKVYLSKTEYETMKGEEILAPYKDNVVLFEGDAELPYGIKAVSAPGHTPGHTCYQKGDVLIAGDIMHAVALQIAYPEFNARFDQDKDGAAASRAMILKMAEDNNLLLGGMHFPEGGVIDYRK